jgi:opacity protein-like surface antigen
MANKWFTTAALAVGLVAIPAVASAETQVRIFGGVSENQNSDVTYYYGSYQGEVSIDSGFVVGAAYGGVYGNWVLEGELAFRETDLEQFDFGFGPYDLEGDISATSVMANAWYNFPISGSFGVYVGGGAGLAQAEISEENFIGDDDSMEFIWQVGGGVNFRTASGYAFGVGYRHVEIGDVGTTGVELNSDEVIVEVSRRF